MKWLLGLIGAALLMGVIGFWLSRNPSWLHERIEAPIVESSAMRWYRCLGSGRPLLGAPSARWTLNYSWSDGFGPGSVAVEIGSDGHARMQAWPADGASIHRSAVLSPGQVRRIAALVDETGVLCQVPEAHPAFTVEDRGTYVLSVRGGQQNAAVFVDECHEIADGAAFGAVLEGIRTLRGVLGEEVDWGPEGSVGLDSPCRPVTPRVLVPQRAR